MNISAKTEYACIAVLELAANYGSGDPVRIRSIADRHGIPSRFLVQILLQLKSGGYVASTRGAAGGYQLIKDPAEISVADVMCVFESHLSGPASNITTDSPASRSLLRVWSEAAEEQLERLHAVSFADLVEDVRGQTNNMYYI